MMQRKKSLGQCFLEDGNILALEARLADVAGKRVLEIGPGDGRLSQKILEAGPSSLILVEKDSRFAALLRERFASDPRVHVIEADFLEAQIPPFDIVLGNIPYYISSDIVFTLALLDFERGVLMVQKEFAEKMVAKPGDSNYGRLSVTSQIAFDIKLERKVLRHLFRPAPKVDSAIITIKPTGVRLSAFSANIIRSLFSHRNKTVRNALMDSKMFDDAGLRTIDSGILKRRVRTLSKEECLAIGSALQPI